MRIYLAIIALVVCCNIASAQSVNERASELAVKELTKDLPQTSIYEGLMKVDSAFSPLDEPECFYQIIELGKIADKAKGLIKVREYLRELVRSYEQSGKKGGVISRKEYQDAKIALGDIDKQFKMFGVYAESLVGLLSQVVEKPSKFIGFKTLHRYKIIDESGAVRYYTRYFLFDDQLSRILISYDADTTWFKEAQEFLAYIRKQA